MSALSLSDIETTNIASWALMYINLICKISWSVPVQILSVIDLIWMASVKTGLLAKKRVCRSTVSVTGLVNFPVELVVSGFMTCFNTCWSSDQVPPWQLRRLWVESYCCLEQQGTGVLAVKRLSWPYMLISRSFCLMLLVSLHKKHIVKLVKLMDTVQTPHYLVWCGCG